MFKPMRSVRHRAIEAALAVLSDAEIAQRRRCAVVAAVCLFRQAIAHVARASPAAQDDVRLAAIAHPAAIRRLAQSAATGTSSR